MPDLLTFALGGQTFALAAESVVEVTRLVAVALVPGAPAIVEGVINVRGTLVPVVDVRGRFDIPPVGLDPDQHLIVANAGSRRVALRVDRALDFLSVPDDAVEPVERVAPGGTRLVAGLARLPDGVLVIHDLERFLSLDEARQLDAALGAAAAT